MAESSDKSIERKVLEWLKTEGWPFEIRVGREFAKNGWKVRHGEFYTDPVKSIPREVDIIATTSSQDGTGVVNLDLVIECKVTRDKPWVGFTSPLYAPDLSGVGITEVDVRDSMWRRELIESHLRWKPPRPRKDLLDASPDPLDFAEPNGADLERWLEAWGSFTRVDTDMGSCHTVIQAFRDGNGTVSAYVATHQVEAAAQALATVTSKLEVEMRESGWYETSIFMPLIVIAGDLLIGTLDAQEILSLQKTDHLHVRTEHGMVLVLADSAVAAFARDSYRLARTALGLTSFVGDDSTS